MRSFLIFFFIVDFRLVHLAILLDFLFIGRETDNATAFNNTFKPIHKTIGLPPIKYGGRVVITGHVMFDFENLPMSHKKRT